MKKTVLLFVFFAIFSANFLSAQITGSIMHEGIEREYRLFLPSNYQNYEALPLVFNLHGFNSNGSQQELYTLMNNVADTAKFFVCYAEGHKYNGGDQAWNVGWAIGSNKDDVGFFDKLIDTLSQNYNIDTEAVFSTGMSNGGFMSYKLACELNDRIKAVASVTGSLSPSQDQTCAPEAPIPVMQIHGTADDIVQYNGTAFVSIPIEDLISKWVGFNNCSMESDTIPVPDIDPNDGTTSERIEYNNCDDDSRVVFYKVTGGEHSWPGTPIDIAVTSHDFNASHEIWLFFRQYTSPLIVSNKAPLNIVKVNASPNPFKEYINVESQKGNLKSIKIHNSIGQLVFYRSEINAQNYQVQSADLQKGVYFINIETTEGDAVLKSIKQ